jgi:predicted negative regulator of RcsB-dependent stress response
MSAEPTESSKDIEFLAWLEVNKKKLLIGAAIVGLVAAVLAISRWYRQQAEASASAALFQVHLTAVDPASSPAAQAQALLDVATAHSGTSAGAQASLLAASALFRENKFGEAKTQFDAFLKEYPDNPLASTAVFGLAACLDAMGKSNEALTAYEDVANRFSGTSIASQAKMQVAGLYEARNEPAQALKVYQELARAGGRSAWAGEASMRRVALLSHHPELAETNAPPPAVTSVVPGISNLIPSDANVSAPAGSAETK